MAEAGSLEIIGKIDITSIKHALNEMKTGLDEAKSSAKSAFGDMERLAGPVGDIAAGIGALGVGLATSFLAVASLSPAVAPALAKMDVAFKQLVRTIGEEMQPTFDMFADTFQGFADWSQGDGRIVFSSLNNAFEIWSKTIGGITSKIDGLKEALGGITELLPPGIKETVQGAMGGEGVNLTEDAMTGVWGGIGGAGIGALLTKLTGLGAGVAGGLAVPGLIMGGLATGTNAVVSDLWDNLFGGGTQFGNQMVEQYYSNIGDGGAWSHWSDEDKKMMWDKMVSAGYVSGDFNNMDTTYSNMSNINVN